MFEQERPLERIEFGEGDILFSDLDRTLIISDKLSGYAYRMLARQQPHYGGAIEETMYEELHNRGNAYEYLRLLRQRGVEVDPVQLARDIVADHTTDGMIDPEFVASILNEGAIGLLGKVQAAGGKNVLMTAGDELTQLFKVTLVSEIARQGGVGIDGWIMMMEGSTAKAAIVDTMLDEASGHFRFDREKLLNLAGQNNHLLIQDCYFDTELIVGDYDRVTIYDDKLKHLLLPPNATVGRPIGDLGAQPIVTTSSGKMRLIHAVATGMPDDSAPRITPAQVMELVQAA